MKIAMLGHKRVPSREGGVEVVVTELATRMAAMGHDVTVYSRAGEGQKSGEFDYKNVCVRTVRTLDIRGLAAATSSYYATKAAIKDRPDIIHFHAEGPCVVMPLASRAGIRTVATIHGLDWRRAKWGKLASRYIKQGEKTAVKHADEMIVLSRDAQRYFVETYGFQTTYIPNGIESKALLPAVGIKSQYGLTYGSYLLFLGRIVPEKGIHSLLQAYRNIETDKRLVIAGGSSDSQGYCEEIKRLAAADDRVLFTGFVDGAELAELYSNAYAYVLPSDLEGMPMSLLEAMAYKRCCVTSDIPECVEVLGKTGITFERGNVMDLQATLIALLQDAQAVRQLGQAAADRAASHFSWDRVVQETLRVYDAVLARG